MKRYIKELANDVRKKINREAKNMQLPYKDIEKLLDDIDFITSETGACMLTDRDAVSALVVVWDKLIDLRWARE